MWDVKKNGKQRTKLIDTEARLVAAWGVVWRVGAKGVKRYKIPVIRQINPGDTVYSTVTKVNNTALHILKLLRVKSSHYKKKNSTTVLGGRSH